MIILIDGPEKAGKSTLIKALAEKLHARVRPWGQITPDDRVYTPFLRSDTFARDWVIWDRGWPSEHVYGRLLNRDRRLARDPFLGEWLHGRAVQTAGVRCMLVPHDFVETTKRVDETDLKVDRFHECMAFAAYGADYNYTCLTNFYTDQSIKDNIEIIMSQVTNADKLIPPLYAGPYDAKVMFLGESRNDEGKHSIPGAWLPFTSRLTMELGRRMGNKAFSCGWTNVEDVSYEFMLDKFVVACGEQASDWVQDCDIDHVSIPHPAWLYRFATPQTLELREQTDKILKQIGEKIK